MATINENLFVKGARGNVGKQIVYRRHGDNTTITRMPRINENAVTSEDHLLEEGNAALAPINREQWIYTTSQANATLVGLTIIATATDLPGNTAVLEITL